jgi:chromosome segregation ATPase
MASEGFWSRIGHWFRSTNNEPTAVSRERSASAVAVAEPNSPESSETALGATLSETESTIVPASSSSRPPRWNQMLERLEDGYTKVIDLVENIQTHMARQDQRTELMSHSLDKLAEHMSHLPAASESQAKALEALAVEIREDASRSRRVEDQLAQLPSLADAQRETMAAISRQMDAAAAGEAKMDETMTRVRHSLTELSDAAQASTATMHRIHEAQAAREDRTEELLRAQTWKFTWFVAIGGALVVLCAAVLIVTMLQ